MALETGKHWSVLLKSALISMNSTKKNHMNTPRLMLCGEGNQDMRISCLL